MADATANLREVAPGQYELDLNLPRGEKGDPGGIVDGTVLDGTQDLNDIFTSGTYFTSGASAATLLKNYPVQTIGGTLVVWRRGSDTILTQEYYQTGGYDLGRMFFRRVRINSTWYPWRAFSSQRVDQTAGRAIYTYDDLNNREQLIYGDTGWRDIKSLIVNGWVTASLLIRRVGSLVQLSGYYLNSADATSTLFAVLPEGFRMRHSGETRVIAKSQSTTGSLISSSSGNLVSGDLSGVYGQNGHFSIEWLTDNPWPTTLPGNASGGIPNL